LHRVRPLDPLVSVVLPTYNRLELLIEAVDSVRAQSLTDWELIVVDDGSTDGTDRWVGTIADPRVRLVAVPHSGNIARVRNIGVDAARSEWLAFLDSDDRWTPEKLTRQIARISDAPAAVCWCYTGFRTIDRAGREVPVPHGARWKPAEGWLVEHLLRYEAAVPIQTVLVPARLVRELRFDEQVPLVDDYELTLRLAAAARGVVVDDPLVEIRLHDARTTTIRGYMEVYVGKALALRRAAETLTDPRASRLARRQLRAHVMQLAARAIRRGDLLPLIRAFRRLMNEERRTKN
jgi:glycosyltransferase involved in cell wall biosynthesis